MVKLLLAEDDKSLREIYTVRLEAEGYQVTAAGDGEEALAAAINNMPDLIISDVMMPKISGFEMLDLLRSNAATKNIPVIMLTALSSDQQRERGDRLGADRYLIKSQVGIEDIVRVVHESLEEHARLNAAPTNEPQQPQAQQQTQQQSGQIQDPQSLHSNYERGGVDMPANFQSAFNPASATNPSQVANHPIDLPNTPLSVPTRGVFNDGNNINTDNSFGDSVLSFQSNNEQSVNQYSTPSNNQEYDIAQQQSQSQNIPPMPPLPEPPQPPQPTQFLPTNMPDPTSNNLNNDFTTTNVDQAQQAAYPVDNNVNGNTQPYQSPYQNQMPQSTPYQPQMQPQNQTVQQNQHSQQPSQNNWTNQTSSQYPDYQQNQLPNQPTPQFQEQPKSDTSTQEQSFNSISGETVIQPPDPSSQPTQFGNNQSSPTLDIDSILANASDYKDNIDAIFPNS